MAISATTLLSFSLSFLLLCHASLSQFESGDRRSPWESTRRLGSQSECRIEKLNAQEPRRRIKSEAGHTEYFDDSNEQFDCAGVSALRRTIQPGGLLLPSFSNAPTLVYVVQGRGITGVTLPGCPESYQEFQESGDRQREREGQQRVRDQHQRIQHFREGDVIALPAGVSHWCYNTGESPVVTINVIDTSNSANQLDRNHRQFMLAGSQQQQRGQEEQHGRRESERENSGNNILNGFDTETLADAMGISRDLAEKLKGRKDQRGEIVKVQGRLEVLRPSGSDRGDLGEQEYGYKEEEEREEGGRANGLEQAFCNMRIKENIGDSSSADVYNPNGGRLTSLNSQKHPILRYLRLSAVRGSLRRNAFLAPLWKPNAHSIMYVLHGSCRCQVTNNRGQTVFNGEVRQGQILVIPQHFAQLKQSRSDDFEWITIETNDNTISNPIVGKSSALKGMPEEVLMNSYRISREEARMVKRNRGEELGVFAPRSQSQQRQGRDEA